MGASAADAAGDVVHLHFLRPEMPCLAVRIYRPPQFGLTRDVMLMQVLHPDNKKPSGTKVKGGPTSRLDCR